MATLHCVDFVENLMIIRSFSGRATCENPIPAAFNARVPSRHDDAAKDRSSAVVGGHFQFFSKLRLALCRRIGPFNWRRSAAMVSAWLILVARINKFPPAGTQLAMALAD
jgi:hypothetical protein